MEVIAVSVKKQKVRRERRLSLIVFKSSGADWKTSTTWRAPPDQGK